MPQPTPARPTQTPRQYLESVSPELLFPKDRAVLLVKEVAQKLGVAQEHILDLIEEGKIIALDVAGPMPFTPSRAA